MKRIAVFAASVALVLCLIPELASAGFGVSPPLIREDKLVPGSEFVRKISLVQGNPTRDLPASVVVESDTIKSWVSFPVGKEFVIPEGVQQYPMLVHIKVPENADLGVYKAFIRISTMPEATTEGGTVAVALGGLVEVELTVGDEVVVDYEVSHIDILDIKEGENPKAEIKIQNKGNAPVAPDSATFELFDKFGNQRLSFLQADSKSFDRVPAFSESTIIVEFPIDLRIAPGEYWGEVKVYNDEGSVLRAIRTVFNVTPKTFLEKIIVPLTIVLVVLAAFGLFTFFMRIANSIRRKKLKNRV